MSWLSVAAKAAGIKVDSMTMKGVATMGLSFVVAKLAPHVDMQQVAEFVDIASTGLAIIGTALAVKGYERRKAMPAETPAAS